MTKKNDRLSLRMGDSAKRGAYFVLTAQGRAVPYAVLIVVAIGALALFAR